jgi:hypothetical protein
VPEQNPSEPLYNISVPFWISSRLDAQAYMVDAARKNAPIIESAQMAREYMAVAFQTVRRRMPAITRVAMTMPKRIVPATSS